MIPMILIGLVFGVGLAALLTLLFGVYTIGPTERGVVTTFGRVQRLAGTTGDDPQLGANFVVLLLAKINDHAAIDCAVFIYQPNAQPRTGEVVQEQAVMS